MKRKNLMHHPCTDLDITRKDVKCTSKKLNNSLIGHISGQYWYERFSYENNEYFLNANSACQWQNYNKFFLKKFRV